MEQGTTEIIRIDRIIDSPWQGRQLSINSTEKAILEMVNDLVKSIEKNGLLQPVIVRIKGDKYELIDGHRRALAAKILGMESLPALIIEADDKKAQIASVISNLERKDLHPIEKAIAYKKILDDGIFGNISELAESIGKSNGYIGEILNNLQLDNRIIEDLIKNKTITDNRILRALRKFCPIDNNGKSDRQWDLYKRVINQKLTRNHILELVKTKKAAKTETENKTTTEEIEKEPEKKITENKLATIETEKDITFILKKNGLSKEVLQQLTDMIEKFVISVEVGHDQPL